MIQKTITSAGLKVYINGIPFGIATSVSWQSDQNKKPIYGIDQVSPFEITPGPQLISGTITCTRIHGDGGLEGRGISAPDERVSIEKYISIFIMDRITGLPVLFIPEATVNSQRWSATARGLLEGSFDFIGLEWQNEAPLTQ